MIYFLRNTPHKAWRKILPAYFRSLMVACSGDVPLSEGARRKALSIALATALKGVDIEKLEAAWKAYRY